MIRGIHGLLYSSEPEQLRAFLRDQLQLPAADIGGGWLIYDFEHGDLGVHPAEEAGQSGKHDISFFTDDLAATVAEITARGVTLEHDIEDHGYGLVTHVMAPGGVRIQIYQPKYEKPATEGTAKKAKRDKPKKADKKRDKKRDKKADKKRSKADKPKKKPKPEKKAKPEKAKRDEAEPKAKKPKAKKPKQKKSKGKKPKQKNDKRDEAADGE